MSTAIDPALQTLLDKAARLQRRINFRRETDKILQQRLEKLRTEIAARVPASAAAEAFASQTAGGGTSYNLAAAGGANIRVTQPAPKLLGKISGELVQQLRDLCGDLFDRLFVTHYTCAKNVRVLAFQLLDKKKAKRLLALVEEPSIPTVTITA